MTEMGDKVSNVLLGFLIFPLVFLTNIGIIGSTELQPGEAFVCGPRTIYGNFKVIERTYEPCESGSCLVERVTYVHEKQVFYCCPGYSQSGTSCSQECDADHYYGENCTQICTCAPEHTTGCNSASGDCDCVPGKGGANCTDDCAQGTFGVSCRGTCNCSHTDASATCEPINGTCSCSSEFYGNTCEFRYFATTYEVTTIGSTKDASRRTPASSVRKCFGTSIIIANACVGILVLVIIAVLIIWTCTRKKNGVTRRNSSTIATGPYYSSIPGDITQEAGSTTGATSLNLVTRSTNDSENVSALVMLVPREMLYASTQTSTNDIAYAKSESAP